MEKESESKLELLGKYSKAGLVAYANDMGIKYSGNKEEVQKALLIKTYEELSTELQRGGYALLKTSKRKREHQQIPRKSTRAIQEKELSPLSDRECPPRADDDRWIIKYLRALSIKQGDDKQFTMATASDLGWTESELHTNQRIDELLALSKRVDFVKDNTGNLWVVKQSPDIVRARKEFRINELLAQYNVPSIVNVGGFCIGRASEDLDNEVALILLPYIKSHNLDYLTKNGITLDRDKTLKGLVKFLDFFKQTSPLFINNTITLFIGDVNATQVLVTSESEFYYVDFGVAQLIVRGGGGGGMAGSGTDDILVRSADENSMVYEDAHRRVLVDVYKLFEEEYTRDAIHKLCCRDISPDMMKKRIQTHIEELKHRAHPTAETTKVHGAKDT